MPKIIIFNPNSAKSRIHNHLSYKLGQALMQANKNWYGGGYIKFIFKDVPRLKREFEKGAINLNYKNSNLLSRISFL